MSCLGLHSISPRSARRPSFDAEWFRAVQGRLLADGDLPCHWQTPWGGGSLGWTWTRSLSKREEVEAVTPCAEASEGGNDVVCGRGVFRRGGSNCWLCDDEGACVPDLERLVLGLRWRQPYSQTVEHGAVSPCGEAPLTTV